jgi:hypothetical protein
LGRDKRDRWAFGRILRDRAARESRSTGEFISGEYRPLWQFNDFAVVTEFALGPMASLRASMGCMKFLTVILAAIVLTGCFD